MTKRYDCIIIGTGPAGLEAAITLKNRNKDFLIFGKKLSSKVEKASEINNYLGLPGITGEKLNLAFDAHLKQMDIQIQEDAITVVYPMDGFFSLLSKSNQTFEAGSVILAMGVSFGKPYPGEEEFLGKGVSYCATCDAMLYKGKTVAVIGGDPGEEKEAAFLSEVAGKVYYIPLYKTLEDQGLKEKAEVVWDRPVKVEGTDRAETLQLEHSTIQADGIFILRESISPKQLVPGIQMERNHILVNRQMETNLKGCFACGDITGTPYQYIKAAGEGNVAALSASAYLDCLTIGR